MTLTLTENLIPTLRFNPELYSNPEFDSDPTFPSGPTFTCEVIIGSFSLDLIKSHVSILSSLVYSYTGLEPKSKIFTLFRSPLGNKRSKDQFLRKEHFIFLRFRFKKASELLKLIDLLKYCCGGKLKAILFY